ncbi:Protein yippee [Babesia microti strain RI]|uniref:Protein yippee-like n=1 Tax=Babesia microti (strain RI) TaxID=1133968 RepID=A0A1N6LXV8_BABMR|nr:Protein yippee [Babesia microti strain RI]SIO73719.1 Protein yippee [Babesia microti strain RI]|eukprot:XP_021337785.1 Protein yippee [Babesia microti strain RI]
MGRLFKEYIKSRDIYSCSECQNHLTCLDDLVSTSFRGRTGSAWLFSRVINVTEGPFEDRMMTTGQHTIVDIYCNDCGSNLGWKYQEATEESEKYKCGMYILEKALLTRLTHDPTN